MRSRSALITLTFVFAACGSSVGALSVSAAQSADDGRIKVTGWVRASVSGEDAQIRLCAGLDDSDEDVIPLCEEPFLEISVLAPSDLPLESEDVDDGVEYWSEERMVLDLDKSGDEYVFAGLSE